MTALVLVLGCFAGLAQPAHAETVEYSLWIGGELKNCVVIFTADPFEQPGDSFFDSMQTRLVPTDDPGVSYGSDEAANFWDVFGRNTDYVIDPEETLADNFAYTLVYGTDRDYESRELILSIDEYLRSRAN